jgi:hypothetical protein
MCRYYIYSLTDPRNGTIRYIGKGTGKRWLWCLHNKCAALYGVEPWVLRLRNLGLAPITTKVLEGLSNEQANRWEIGLIASIGRHPDGPLLNCAPGGLGGCGKHSEETKRKLSEAQKGRLHGPMSEEHRRAISIGTKGKVVSEKTRRKLAEAGKGKTASEDTRRKIGEASKGRKFDEEARRKISEANRGKLVSEETRRKLAKGRRGKRHTKEARRKMSEAAKNRRKQRGFNE